MPWGRARLAVALCTLLWCMHAAAALPATTVLRDEQGTLDAQPIARSWVDTRGDATLAQVLDAPALFQPAVPAAVHRLPKQGALWLQLRLQRADTARHDWILKLPMPVLDRVTVYQREAGGWRAETAGDTIAVNRWPEAGRYPFFRLDLPPSQVRDVYVRVEHSAPAPFPIELATEGAHDASVQMEYLGIGAAFGALLLLIGACSATGWAYRDTGFAWYAGYATLTSLALSAYTGVAAQFLWPGFDLLQDAPTNMLACATVGAAILFVRKTLGLRRRLPALDRLTLIVGALGPVVAVVPALAPKFVYFPVIGIYLCCASPVALVASAMTAWRGDRVARWVFAAQFPLVTAVVVTVSRNLGWADLPFLPQYVVMLALAVEVPLLLVALFIRTRDRHSAEVRAQALSTHDGLTGLLAPHLFSDRLRQVVARHRRDGEDAAVMYIDLVNHGRIRAYFGASVAEQSVLRSVIKLRRLLRDVDTVARLGEARFGVILEGASSRSSVNERATRLIAAGLMPLPGLKPDVTLQFHVAALLLSERPLEPDAIHAALDGQLARMSPRTRRPIRFIQAQQEGTGEGGDSALFPQDVAPAAEYASTP